MELEDFKEYIQSTWIRGQYPRAMWNFYTYDGPHTNNRLDRWHNWLKQIVKKPHPNIYEIIDVFERKQATVEVTMLQLETGGNPPPRKRRYIEQDKRLQKLKERMTDGTVSINEYISAVAHLVGLCI